MSAFRRSMACYTFAFSLAICFPALAAEPEWNWDWDMKWSEEGWYVFLQIPFVGDALYSGPFKNEASCEQDIPRVMRKIQADNPKYGYYPLACQFYSEAPVRF